MTQIALSRTAALRVAAAAAALVAALGPHAAGDERPRSRVLLVDQSASCGARGAGDAETAAALGGLGPADRVSIVAFADGALTVAGPAAPDELRAERREIGRWATSLSAGLRAAAALVREGDRAEFLVATDGRVTDDDAQIDAAADAVRRAGGAVLRVLPREPLAPESVVLALRGPGRASVGEVVAIEARGVAGPRGATVELLQGGDVVDRRRIERPGPFRTAFARVADVPGLATWTARTAEVPDAPPAAARVVVAAPGAVAIVARRPVRPALAGAAGGNVTAIDVVRAGTSFADRIAGHDAVLLDDLSADDAGPLVSALEAFVRGGGGILVAGGERSWSAGGWGGATEFESLVPLRATPPEDEGVVLYLAIDGSGSMGEPWPGAAATSSSARDLAARDAARRLVRAAPSGARLFLRRFREDVVPAGSRPVEIVLAPPNASDPRPDARRIEGERAVDALPAPGGATAFLPVLREALDVLGGRTERARVALFLSDGRSAEDPSELAAQLGRLADAGVRVGIVVPGPLEGVAAGGAGSGSLLRAATERGVAVRGAETPERLAEALLAAERGARAGEPFASARDLELTGDAALLAGGAGRWPLRALRMNRTWAAPDAVVLARTTDLLPLAALRSAPGGARVAAVAARVADSGGDPWLDGDGGASMLRALLGAVRRRAAASVRIDVEGTTLFAALSGADGGTPAHATEMRAFAGESPRGSAPLLDAGGGLVAAELPAAADADRVSFLGEDGAEIASAGLDRPAPAELRGGRAIDFGALAARIRPPDAPEPVSLRPAFAALAVLLLVLASVKSGPAPAR